MKIAKFATMAAVVALSASLPAAPAHAQSEPILGQLMPVGFNFCPRGWSGADGQLMAIAQNTALFSLYGTTYGGDGRTTFGLPDLRGRSPIHTGTGPGLSPYTLGSRGGAEQVTLNTLQIPSHNHVGEVHVSRTDATTRSPAGAYFARTDQNTLAYEENTPPQAGDTMNAGTVTTQNTGGNQPHYNLSPYLTLRWCVAMVGVYPSRN